MREEAPLYRKILEKALKTAWTHRELWPLAALAGLVMTGTVVHDVIIQAHVANGALAGGLGNVAPFLDAAVRALSAASQGGPWIFSLSAFLIVGGAFLFALVLVSAQHAILRVVHRATARKARVPLRTLLRETVHPRFVSMALVNAAAKVLMGNLMIGGGLLLRTLNTEAVFFDAFFGFLFVLMTIVLACGIGVVAMFALIEISRRDASVAEAIGAAWKMARRNLAICVEMAVVLFAVHFVITAMFLAALFLATGPILVFFGLAIDAGSLVAFSGITLAALLLFITALIAFAGFVTTMTYAAWTELAILLEKKTPLPRLHHHIGKATALLTTR